MDKLHQILKCSCFIATLMLTMIGCDKTKKDHATNDTYGTGIIETGNIEPQPMSQQDSVYKVLSLFTSVAESSTHSKRIDRVNTTRITYTKLDDSTHIKLVIKHEDLDANYYLGEVVVPVDFDIQTLNNGWVCSVRNNSGLIDGPFAIFYSNFNKMYETTYIAGVQSYNKNVFDSNGNILTHETKNTENI